MVNTPADEQRRLRADHLRGRGLRLGDFIVGSFRVALIGGACGLVFLLLLLRGERDSQ
jgi:hypothetical protein